MTKRDIVEDFLLDKIPHVKIFDPENAEYLEQYKNGNFGLGIIGFSLYSNGHNLRGKSSRCKYGLVFEDGENVFSIGYFRKENDPVDSDGYVFITAPTGKESITKVLEIVKTVRLENLPIKGFYIRYLGLDKYIEILSKGALPVKESPWHPEAPEEDETFSNSLVNIHNVLTIEGDAFSINKIEGLSKNSKKKIKYAYSRFSNFLSRNSLVYRLEYLGSENSHLAFKIIKSHFEMLRKYGKDIGSTPEDHFNAVDPRILRNKNCLAYVGFLGELPVSIFVGEGISTDAFALYTPFTLRDSAVADAFLSSESSSDFVGLTAMPTFAYVQLLFELGKKGFKYVDFGGSEIADLNRFKRQLGGENKPSYWAYIPF